MALEFLSVAADALFSLPNYRAILLNVTGAIGEDTDAATILSYEPIQTTGGYQSAEVPYTAGTSVYDAAIDRQVSQADVSFTEAVSGSGYTFTHVALWQGRGAISNRPITSVNTSNGQITCTAHGLTNGDRAFVNAIGVLPTGYTIQRYWAQVVNSNTVVLHSNAGLSAPVIPSDAGTGQLHLVHANGQLAGAVSAVGTILLAAGQSTSFANFRRFR